MNRLLTLVSIVAALSLILTACNGLGPGAAGQNATEPPVTEAATEPPTVVPIDLAGPEMRVGSLYTYIDGSILAAVPDEGPFKMGLKNYFDAEEHTVTVSDFWIYTNEVTNEQFDWCVSLGKCTDPDLTDDPEFHNYRFASFPVVGVNYQQAADYCAFVNGRLPTEAEWEKAARGPESNLFPWGDAAPVCDLLNFNFCKGKPVQVKSYPDGTSFYGLSDMSGNVKEWVADYYRPEYDLTQLTDPVGALIGQKRSVRSSSFSDSADFAFAAHRFSLNPVDHLVDLGFRCVVDDPTFFAPYCQGMVMYGADVNGAPGDPVSPVPGDCQVPGLSTTLGPCESGWTRVTINPWPQPADFQLDIDPSTQCGPDPDPGAPDNRQYCTGSGDVIYSSPECKVTPPANVDATCEPGFGQPEQDPNDPGQVICKGQGPGVNCPDGFDFNPLLHCCSAVNAGPHQYGFCVAFDQQDSACYNDPGDDHPATSVQVHIDPPGKCGESGGDDTEGGCTQVCSPYWPYTCTCN